MPRRLTSSSSCSDLLRAFSCGASVFALPSSVVVLGASFASSAAAATAASSAFASPVFSSSAVVVAVPLSDAELSHHRASSSVSRRQRHHHRPSLSSPSMPPHVPLGSRSLAAPSPSAWNSPSEPRMFTAFTGGCRPPPLEGGAAGVSLSSSSCGPNMHREVCGKGGRTWC